MSQQLAILHALSETFDPRPLVDTIGAHFPTATQDLAASDDLISDLRQKPYSILFLENKYPSSYTVTQLLKKIEAEFTELTAILIVDDLSAEDLHVRLGNAPFYFLTKPV